MTRLGDFMSIHPHDIAGTAGVALIVYCYLALQAGWMTNVGWRYSALNALGAALVLLSLTQAFNLSAFIIEAFWLLISVYGLLRAKRERLRPGDD